MKKLKTKKPIHIEVTQTSLASRWYVWQIYRGGRVLCISSKAYFGKPACLKAVYEVQYSLMEARIFVNGKEL